MSNGALTQLAAIGVQDKMLMSNDIKDSLFVESNKKITNFVKSTESLRPIGSSNWGSTVNFRIEKKGDMLSSLYFVVKLPKISRTMLQNQGNDYYLRWVDYVGNVLIDNIKLYIGGQLIDEHYGDFLQIYTDLYDNNWNKKCLLGLDDSLTQPSEEINSTYLYIPLKFWFCNSLEKALPIIALQYHEIDIEIKIRDFECCYQVLQQKTDNQGDTGFVHMQQSNKLTKQNLLDIRLDCNYIYLESEERKKMAQSEHKILITQLQRRQCAVSQGRYIDLTFNHPVKELLFYLQNTNITGLPDIYNFSGKTEYMSEKVYNHYIQNSNKTFKDYNNEIKGHLLDEARILINGYPRVDWKDFKYYYYLQNYENYRNKLEHYIYMYCFSSKPKSDLPSGSLNFSRVDNAQIQFKINEDTKDKIKEFLDTSDHNLLSDNYFNATVYATNYNYLVIKGGMGGLSYQN